MPAEKSVPLPRVWGMLATARVTRPPALVRKVPVSLERTKVASYRFFGAFLAGWLIATFVTPLKNILSHVSDTDFMLRKHCIIAPRFTEQRFHTSDIHQGFRSIITESPCKLR